MTFVSRHNHGRRSGIDFGARAFLLSSRSNPPALSTACSTASLFSTDRWDASGPEGRVSASDFAFRALARPGLYEARHNDEKHNSAKRQDHHGFGIRNG